jgi:O-antigen/teichoic acid export membrane protein
MTEISSNKRIAKNTLLLYLRTIIVMIVSLYTSRVVLQVLGVDDYGIYNVVGGVVTMFSLISSALSSSIQRFLTFELGHGDKEKLKRIFSTAINIQIVLAILIVFLIETLGLWFVNYKMNIPANRVYAANWVLHGSALAFAVSLMNVPYNALIVAHEKMSAFAYISIIEVSFKLGIVYLLYISPIDKLVLYSILQAVVMLIICVIYCCYCIHNFSEARYHRVHDKELVKEMFGFAGWNFFTNGAYLFNTQGVNIAINMFFSVGINAARGIATQVQSAFMQFVDNFSTALNPQITKLYASGNIIEMVSLVNRGARFTYLLSLIICLPILVETDFILHLWLTEVPPHTVAFVRLAIIGTMIERLGKTGYTACMATGNIKRYVIWITSVGCLVFPLTIIAYYLGAPVETTYVIFAIVYIGVDAVRLWIMKGLLDFPVNTFIKEVVIRILIVTIVALIVPVLFVALYPSSFYRFIASIVLSLLSAIVASFYLGLTYTERLMVRSKVYSHIKKR